MCERHAKIAEMLIDAGYRHSWTQRGPRDFSKRFAIECWVGSFGVILLQVWDDDNGVAVYSERGIPSKWEDFAAWLSAAG